MCVTAAGSMMSCHQLLCVLCVGIGHACVACTQGVGPKCCQRLNTKTSVCLCVCVMCVSHHRQRDEVQSAAKSRLFPPADMTTALVSLNRCMYAQLMQVRLLSYYD